MLSMGSFISIHWDDNVFLVKMTKQIYCFHQKYFEKYEEKNEEIFCLHQKSVVFPMKLTRLTLLKTQTQTDKVLTFLRSQTLGQQLRLIQDVSGGNYTILDRQPDQWGLTIH